MFDLIIRGDRVVTPQGAGAWDGCVAGETIAAVAAPGVVDARPPAAIDHARLSDQLFA